MRSSAGGRCAGACWTADAVGHAAAAESALSTVSGLMPKIQPPTSAITMVPSPMPRPPIGSRRPEAGIAPVFDVVALAFASWTLHGRLRLGLGQRHAALALVLPPRSL